MSFTRRQFLTAASGFAVSHALLRRVGFGQEKKPTRVVLLGTKGGPRVGESGRRNPGTLIMINDVPYLVDCGYGVSKQLITAKVALDRLRYLFITHHHSDHNLEFGPLIYNTWITGLPAHIDAYGPTGLTKMAGYSETSLIRSYGIVIAYLNRVGLSARDPFNCPLAGQLGRG